MASARIAAEISSTSHQAEASAREISTIRKASDAELTGDMSDWNIYILRCADGTLYTGIATDVSRRIREHEQGKRGAKYLRGRGPLELIYQRAVGDRSVATKIEYSVKRLSRTEKEDPDLLRLLVDELRSNA